MFVNFWRDERGFILPYVTIMMVVFIGLGALALDGGRYMSLQTQMQAVADALSLAGARELNQQEGSRARAISAIDNLVRNGLTGLGYTGTITHVAPVFYSALPVATAGFGGTPATSDFDAKFVAVTVNPVTLSTILHIGFNNFSAGSQAIAGFTARAVCDIPPVFICNPYETAGMSDSQATQALRVAMSDATIKRKMIRMDRTSTSPGHFGFLVPPDGCNGANCLKDWIAKSHPNTCYQTPTVDLNTGAMSSVNDAFNVRFDMFKGSINYSTDYAPAVNVRKGYLPGSGADRWCQPKVHQADPYYSLPIITNAPGSTVSNSQDINIPSADFRKNNPLTINPATGMTTPTTISNIPDASRITAAGQRASSSASVLLSSQGITSGLPLDSNIEANPTVIFGNGDWNCLDYWTINHETATPPTGCTKTNPTISRYDVYRDEINRGLVNDWSGNRAANITAGAGNGESGAPYCAGSGTGVDPSLGNDPATGKTYHDRRVIFTAIINCSAQSGLITGGSTANNIPVADFGKFFMTQPIGVSDPKADPNSLYGEMTGLISSLDNVTILNQVQLYR